MHHYCELEKKNIKKLEIISFLLKQEYHRKQKHSNKHRNLSSGVQPGIIFNR